MKGIRRLASHLDISIGTVSRALNGKPDVNEGLPTPLPEGRSWAWSSFLAFHVVLNGVIVVQLWLGGEYLTFIWITPALIAALLMLGGRRTSPNSSGRAKDTPSPA